MQITVNYGFVVVVVVVIDDGAVAASVVENRSTLVCLIYFLGYMMQTVRCSS